MNRLENVNLMKQLTFGVEIEMGNISKRKALNIVKHYYGSDYDDYSGGCHDAYVTKDSKDRVWTFENDGSAPGPVGRITCEMVTPILTYDDIEDLQAIVRLLRQAGAKSGSAYNAGVHIHVGGSQLNAKGVRNLVNIIYKREELFYKAVAVSNNRLGWCKPVDEKFLKEINALKGDKLTLKAIEDCWYGNLAPYDARSQHYNRSRYHLLNLHSLFHGHGTVEFRCFEFKSQLHAGLLKSWIQLALATVSYAQMISRSDCEKVHPANEKWEMRNWLLNMGLIGDEFKTARDLLLRRLSGDSACRVPRAQSLDDRDIAID